MQAAWVTDLFLWKSPAIWGSHATLQLLHSSGSYYHWRNERFLQKPPDSNLCHCLIWNHMLILLIIINNCKVMREASGWIKTRNNLYLYMINCAQVNKFHNFQGQISVPSLHLTTFKRLTNSAFYLNISLLSLTMYFSDFLALLYNIPCLAVVREPLPVRMAVMGTVLSWAGPRDAATLRWSTLSLHLPTQPTTER